MVVLLLAAHVFYMYSTARGMGETFGFHPGTSIIACLFALAMLVPLVWAVFLPDLPEFLSQHVQPRRRWKRGQCPGCGYDRRGLQHQHDDSTFPSVCPECGSTLREPEGWQVSSSTIRRFVAINLLAWLLGCAAGEAWMRIDERDFRREVDLRLGQGDTSNYTRARRWPNANDALLYRHPGEFRATE